MGMFTWVKPANEILPPEFHNRDGWQTKSVVECQLETLEITADGKLLYIWWEREWEDDEKVLLGGCFKPTVEHRDVLDYHGDMVFYLGTEDDPNTSGWSLVEFVARFTEGELQYVKRLSPQPAT